MSEPFIAEVRIWAISFAPRGWAECDGQLLPIAQNTALFSLVGTTFGGDGRTTFGLPNLQGRAAMHPGNGPGLTSRRWGESGGSYTAQAPAQALPEHRHIGGAEGYGPKMESWHVRYGTVDFFGEYKGAGDEKLISEMPENERPWGYGQPWFKSKYVARRTAKSGKLYTLEDPESWHFQRAGAGGAIVAEYATYHNHVEFSKPGMEFDSSKAV